MRRLAVACPRQLARRLRARPAAAGGAAPPPPPAARATASAARHFATTAAALQPPRYAGGHDAGYNAEDAAAAGGGVPDPSAPRPAYPPLPPENPYAPRVRYDARFATSKRNPLQHGFAQAGKYFSLGTDKELGAVFPGGLAGDLQTGEFAATGSNSMLIRPMAVSLVHFMERWRQSNGRELAAAGARVLDVDASLPLEAALPTNLGAMPKPRFAALIEEVRAADGGADGGSDDELPETVPFVSTTAGRRISVMADPASIPFRPVRVLTGPPGVGKSSLLNYAVAYARMNGWLVVLVPDALALMSKARVLVKSRRRPGFVDSHDSALGILRELFSATGSQERLARVPQRGQYAVFRYLPRALDVTVTAARERERIREEAEKARLKAEASARGTEWHESSYKSKCVSVGGGGGEVC